VRARFSGALARKYSLFEGDESSAQFVFQLLLERGANPLKIIPAGDSILGERIVLAGAACYGYRKVVLIMLRELDNIEIALDELQ
jgi:hypothetical protein